MHSPTRCCKVLVQMTRNNDEEFVSLVSSSFDSLCSPHLVRHIGDSGCLLLAGFLSYILCSGVNDSIQWFTRCFLLSPSFPIRPLIVCSLSFLGNLWRILSDLKTKPGRLSTSFENHSGPAKFSSFFLMFESPSSWMSCCAILHAAVVPIGGVLQCWSRHASKLGSAHFEEVNMHSPCK